MASTPEENMERLKFAGEIMPETKPFCHICKCKYKTSVELRVFHRLTILLLQPRATLVRGARSNARRTNFLVLSSSARTVMLLIIAVATALSQERLRRTAMRVETAGKRLYSQPLSKG